MNILAFSKFMVLPLRNSSVPCGHVTLVSAMHLGKAVISTDSIGVSDYIEPEVSGRLVQPGDPKSLAPMIQNMWDDADGTARMGEAGRAFALRYCTEQNSIDYLAKYIAS